ncbi:MAG: class I SAM-dependent methyltransferase [Actinobacteria bacterium]|nr:class I SAM-dependent methyltransferase [Actinomycetota bacterium]
MEGYEASTYGDRWAEIYDAWVASVTGRRVATPEIVAERLAELAGGGSALELAIGTGRIALPLAARGVQVHGIDASEAMVARLREKPGGDRIPVTMGDFADVAVDGSFFLVYVVFNTLFALLTQEDQVRCFANVAAHLSPGGAFVVEAFVPDVTRFDRGQRVEALATDLDEAHLEVSLHDPVGQRVSSQRVVLTEEGTRFYPVNLRYAWPSELDLMARLAGLRLRDRWAGWNGEPFGAGSPAHVSVYELPAG